MPVGYFCLALHAHLPYVRHPERDCALEERWLFEALTETYLPLTVAMKQWTEEGINWRIALSVSPTLASMLTDPLLQDRYSAHLDRLVELAEAEQCRLADAPAFAHLPTFYAERLRTLRSTYQAWGRTLTHVWSELEAQGHLELMTTAATHAFLPLVLTDEAVRAQIETAIESHQIAFGRAPRGMWLPECAYRPGIDEMLREYGIAFTFAETEGLLSADPAPIFGVYAPILTKAGLGVFGRDPESGRQVWSNSEGYPGDYDYREFYRDIGYERPFEQVRDCLLEGERTDTGLKYWRITGRDDENGRALEKAPYQPQWAREKAARHAEHFLWSRQQQVAHLAGLMGRPPVVTAVYDAELFGHWWFEGPEFLDMLVRKIHYDQTDIVLATPSESLELCADWQTCHLDMNTWGRDGYADVWVNPSNDWIYPALHRMERKMVQLASEHRLAEELCRRALNQAARELMLAQASDWAFIMDHRTAVDYAVRRTKAHVNRFERLAQMVDQDSYDPAYISEVEHRDNIFRNIDYRVYTPRTQVAADSEPQALAVLAADSSETTPTSVRRPKGSAPRSTVLMLAWEYPPLVVGGLARHVGNLAETLVKMGWEVHVITRWDDAILSHASARPDVEGGVIIHRVEVMRPHGVDFLDWVLQLNLAMIDKARALLSTGLRINLLHAHDWLVHRVAKALKDLTGTILISTIHATEHGRNGGIYTDLQRRIHHAEWSLTYESAHVIVCSQSMQDEVIGLFSLPTDKVTAIPNGVTVEPTDATDATDAADQVGKAGNLLAADGAGQDLLPAPAGPLSQPTVLFVGRLVREKGVHVLLNAATHIRAAVPNVRFVLIGRGPMEESLRTQAERLGLTDIVQFLGFVSDAERDTWLRTADVCVFPSLYEPFGIVALEAMAAGTPVVVSDVGGLREIVCHEETGLTTFVGHTDSLAQQTIRLLQDRDLATHLAERAQAAIRDRFSWESVAARTVEVYEKALQSVQHEEAPTG